MTSYMVHRVFAVYLFYVNYPNFRILKLLSYYYMVLPPLSGQYPYQYTPHSQEEPSPKVPAC